MSPSSSYLLREPSQSYILYACRHCRPLTGDANNDIDYGLPELVGWMCAMTSPRYTFSSWWSPNQETSRQDLLSLTSLGISFPEKEYFSQIWWAIFLETRFLHFTNMHMEKKVKVSNIQRSLHFHHHLATRRHYLYKLEIQPPSDTTCNCWKIGHQVAPHAFVENLANLNYLKIWPPGGTICKSWKFGDQVVPLEGNI